MVLNKKWVFFVLGVLASSILYFGLKFFRSSSPQPIPNPGLVYSSLEQSPEWLNVSRPLNQKDLQGRILLLDFWTYCCVNCMHILPGLHELEREFGQDLTVIGVHSGKFRQEKSAHAIRSAVIRYEIEHPIVNDADFRVWSRFGIQAWPTLILINPQGGIEGVYPGEGRFKELRAKISDLVRRYKGSLNSSSLPIALERDQENPSLLSFPGKMVYDPDRKGLWVSDSNHNRIVGMDLQGRIQQIFDSKENASAEKRFHRPQGLLYRDHQLYVADTENHLVKKIDLRTQEVQVIAGTGVQGSPLFQHAVKALETPLSSPWDLAFFPGLPHLLVIAMAGTHQLWTLDLQNQTLDVIAGSGREFIDDGIFPLNSLSQPSGLSQQGNRLYFVDSETSSLRVFEKGFVKTLVGKGLFQFGFQDGPAEQALLQHPLGVWAEQDKVWIADTYNHSLRIYDPIAKTLKIGAGQGKPGNRDGSFQEALFNEPSALVRVGNFMYVTDTNNHQIRVLDLNQKKVSTLKLQAQDQEVEVSSPLKPQVQTRVLAASLPRLKHRPEVKLSPLTAARLVFEVPAGWKLNPQAPSWVAFFEESTPGVFQLIQEVEGAAVHPLRLAIPSLKEGKAYRIQGTLYICKKGEESACTLQSFDAQIQGDSRSSEKELKIDLQ